MAFSITCLAFGACLMQDLPSNWLWRSCWRIGKPYQLGLRSLLEPLVLLAIIAHLITLNFAGAFLPSSAQLVSSSTLQNRFFLPDQVS